MTTQLWWWRAGQPCIRRLDGFRFEGYVQWFTNINTMSGCAYLEGIFRQTASGRHAQCAARTRSVEPEVSRTFLEMMAMIYAVQVARADDRRLEKNNIRELAAMMWAVLDCRRQSIRVASVKFVIYMISGLP